MKPGVETEPLTRVPQLEGKAKKVSEERRFFAEGAYEGNASFRAM